MDVLDSLKSHGNDNLYFLSLDDYPDVFILLLFFIFRETLISLNPNNFNHAGIIGIDIFMFKYRLE